MSLPSFNSLMADEDDRLRHFDFLSRTVTNGRTLVSFVILFIDLRLDKLLDGFVAFLDGALHHIPR